MIIRFRARDKIFGFIIQLIAINMPYHNAWLDYIRAKMQQGYDAVFGKPISMVFAIAKYFSDVISLVGKMSQGANDFVSVGIDEPTPLPLPLMLIATVMAMGRLPILGHSMYQPSLLATYGACRLDVHSSLPLCIDGAQLLIRKIKVISGMLGNLLWVKFSAFVYTGFNAQLSTPCSMIAAVITSSAKTQCLMRFDFLAPFANYHSRHSQFLFNALAY